MRDSLVMVKGASVSACLMEASADGGRKMSGRRQSTGLRIWARCAGHTVGEVGVMFVEEMAGQTEQMRGWSEGGRRSSKKGLTVGKREGGRGDLGLRGGRKGRSEEEGGDCCVQGHGWQANNCEEVT
eukprot:383928-Hanusia_phi.AAC.1